jgi:tetratricopeptide (TPR) repeat protein
MEPNQLEEIRRLIAEKQAQTPTITQQPVYGGLHEAAAVLPSFELKPLHSVPGGISEEPTSLERSSYLIDSNKRTLHLSVRREVLKQLMTQQRLRAALAANPVGSDDLVFQTLKSYVDQRAPSLEQQGTRQLVATLQVADWFDGQLPQIPARSEITARLDQLELMKSFQDMVGTHFRGRQHELLQLREYVDALPSQSFLEWLSRGVRRPFKPHELPLLIFGIGGVGKSTLLAKFILDHTSGPNQNLTFVYLDFDRPNLSAEEPITLLIETVKQLGIQFLPFKEECEALAKKWREYLATQYAHNQSYSNAPQTRGFEVTDRSQVLQEFQDLCQKLGITNRPFLMVFDTFEEVQSRSAAFVGELFNFLAELQGGVGKTLPRLRIVLAGRAHIDQAEFPTNVLELFELDPEAAQGYLEARGVSDPKVAKAVAAQVGGHPLNLYLAAELIRKEGASLGGVEGLQTNFLFLKLDASQIQHVLYSRILDHVHDPEVRKLTHPGLVLRRITPELILNVLAEPCGLQVTSLEQAKVLFENLKLEVSLVTMDTDGVLKHRPDVRRMMIGHLTQTEPEKVKRIHEGAVRFYEQRGNQNESTINLLERAEEVYHRLALQQQAWEIDPRWAKGIEVFFGTDTLQELEPPEQAYLADHLGLSVTSEVKQKSDLAVWERITEREVNEYLQVLAFDKALKALAGREERSINSPLYLLESEVLTRLGRLPEALEVIDRGLQALQQDTGGHASQYLDLLLTAARLEVRLGQLEAAKGRLDQAAEVDAPQIHHRLEIGVRRLELDRAGIQSLQGRTVLEQEVAGLLEGLSDEQLKQNGPLCIAALVEVSASRPAVVTRVVSVFGLELAKTLTMQALAESLVILNAAAPTALWLLGTFFDVKALEFSRTAVTLLAGLPLEIIRKVLEGLQSYLTSANASAMIKLYGNLVQGLFELIVQLNASEKQKSNLS